MGARLRSCLGSFRARRAAARAVAFRDSDASSAATPAHRTRFRRPGKRRRRARSTVMPPEAADLAGLTTPRGTTRPARPRSCKTHPRRRVRGSRAPASATRAGRFRPTFPTTTQPRTSRPLPRPSRPHTPPLGAAPRRHRPDRRRTHGRGAEHHRRGARSAREREAGASPTHATATRPRAGPYTPALRVAHQRAPASTDVRRQARGRRRAAGSARSPARSVAHRRTSPPSTFARRRAARADVRGRARRPVHGAAEHRR